MFCESNSNVDDKPFLVSFVLPSPEQDWDQVSAYSGRSIPRPRIYPMENQAIPDDLRSHVSHFSAVGGKVGKARSIADGQSHHSFSNHSQRGYLGSAFPSNLVNSRPGWYYRTPPLKENSNSPPVKMSACNLSPQSCGSRANRWPRPPSECHAPRTPVRLSTEEVVAEEARPKASRQARGGPGRDRAPGTS